MAARWSPANAPGRQAPGAFVASGYGTAPSYGHSAAHGSLLGAE